MQALATPLVSIVHSDVAYTFARRETPGGRAVYGVERQTLDDMIRARPGTIFEIGHRWQLVPAKLYLYEDRHVYLRGRFPLVREDLVGVLALPQLEAVGIFDRHLELPDSLHSGNHVAELLLAAANTLATRRSTLAMAYFIGPTCWFALLRDGELATFDNFSVNAESDAVFYMAALLEHFGVDRTQVPVVVGGQIGRDGQLHRQLSIYFELRDLAAELENVLSDAATELLLAYEYGLRNQSIVTAAVTA